MNRIGMRVLAAVLFAVLFHTVSAWAEPVAATITSLDPRFDWLVPKNAKLETIADGFTWVEGPVWQKQGGYLLFSDIPANAIYKWTPGKGTSLYLKNSGYSGASPFAGKEPGSNGLTFDPQGRLVLCRHGDRQIGRLEANGRITPLADRYDGHRINSPNDLVFKSNGDLYFTDPPFGLPNVFDDAGKAPIQGVYRVIDGRHCHPSHQGHQGPEWNRLLTG
jgi:gluconolactonase